jgi:osmotically-inducible protein OsmY
MRISLRLLPIGCLSLVMAGWGTSRVAAAQAPGAGDAAVVQAIEQRFEVAPGVPSYLIHVTAQDGVVTLSGAVDDILAKDQAGLVAETIPGVRAVHNQIQIRLTGRTPADIRHDIYDTLTAAPALKDDRIYATVQGGFVTLSGTVDSWPERHLAALLAGGVPGVMGVDNKLGVACGIPRSDAKIRADIQSRIRWDPALKAPELEVEVSGGQVRLRGLVESAPAREHVYRDSWVSGVKSVDISGVEIVPNVRVAMNEAGQTNGATLGASSSLTDAQRETAIAEAFHYDPLLRPDHVKVSVKNGVVALNGTVQSLEAKHAAQFIAREFASAGRVKNLLQVQPTERS